MRVDNWIRFECAASGWGNFLNGERKSCGLLGNSPRSVSNEHLMSETQNILRDHRTYRAKAFWITCLFVSRRTRLHLGTKHVQFVIVFVLKWRESVEELIYEKRRRGHELWRDLMAREGLYRKRCQRCMHVHVCLSMYVFIYSTYHMVQWRFTCKIGRQLVKAPLATPVSPYLISLTHPPCMMYEVMCHFHRSLVVSKGDGKQWAGTSIP